MKGYLQRMASSAFGPVGAIRPIAGSIYAGDRPPAAEASPGNAWDVAAEIPAARSGTRADPPAEPRSPSEAPSAARPAERTRSPDVGRLTAAEKQPAPSRNSGAPERVPRPQTNGPVPRAAHAPLFPEVIAPPGTPRASTQPSAPVDERRFPLTGAPAGKEAREVPEGEEGAPASPSREAPAPMEGALERPFVPSVPGDFSQGDGVGVARSGGAAFSVGNGRRDRAASAPNREGASREPDEIQIHIGRIEVVAAQPPAPRPAPKPQRKAPSLDDYLRRRNGRIR